MRGGLYVATQPRADVCTYLSLVRVTYGHHPASQNLLPTRATKLELHGSMQHEAAFTHRRGVEAPFVEARRSS